MTKNFPAMSLNKGYETMNVSYNELATHIPDEEPPQKRKKSSQVSRLRWDKWVYLFY